MSQLALELQEEFKKRFPFAEVYEHNKRRLYITIPKDKLMPVAEFLYKEKGLRLSIATGIDTRDGFEIIYHFSHDATGTYFNIKIFVSKEDPKVDSLTRIFQASNWIEREIYELLGIEFIGHPNLKPLLTSDDWPKDQYPLTRDYE
ncbi:MAG: NADH-quinone oxidoreductase subunit C [candidate division WOR-3 bacterium]|nr:NADH-quinone oxidoreductase subunit C [candidate division WOR-3 bacterium]MDW7987392.1 NADH-quinone oxidoreductase subunit C [candidate division WOR-3 bacterium]